jgi:hypothetical protein
LAQATKAKFLEAGPFHQALTTWGDGDFQESGRSPRGLPGMYAKTAALLGWFMAPYAFLVFGSTGALSALAREHGVHHRAQDSVGAARGGHVRWLKRMGRPAVLEVA